MKILITGAAGCLARLVVERLAPDFTLVGADARPLPPGRRFPGEFRQVRYTQRPMADVFREHRPEILLHLGRVRNTAVSLGERFDTNVLGTRNLLELSLHHGVKKVVVLSTFHVYGAHQLNPTHISEDAPLRATQTFASLADAVELDHAATTFLWRYRRVLTSVLRPVNIVGPSLRNMMTRMLKNRRCPVLLGFDPMMQFVHEEDAADAIALAVKKSCWGIFNVGGEGAVPFSEAIRLAGAQPVPIPHPLVRPFSHAINRWIAPFPTDLVDFFRFPTVISDGLFRRKFGYSPQYSVVETLRSLSEE